MGFHAEPDGRLEGERAELGDVSSEEGHREVTGGKVRDVVSRKRLGRSIVMKGKVIRKMSFEIATFGKRSSCSTFFFSFCDQ